MYVAMRVVHARISAHTVRDNNLQSQEKRARTGLDSSGTRFPTRACHFPGTRAFWSSRAVCTQDAGWTTGQHVCTRTGLTPAPPRARRASLARSRQPAPHSRGGGGHFRPRVVQNRTPAPRLAGIGPVEPATPSVTGDAGIPPLMRFHIMSIEQLLPRTLIPRSVSFPDCPS